MVVASWVLGDRQVPRRSQVPLDGDLLDGVCIDAAPLKAKGSDWVWGASLTEQRRSARDRRSQEAWERRVNEEVKSRHCVKRSIVQLCSGLRKSASLDTPMQLLRLEMLTGV